MNLANPTQTEYDITSCNKFEHLDHKQQQKAMTTTSNVKNKNLSLVLHENQVGLRLKHFDKKRLSSKYNFHRDLQPI